MIEFTEGDVMPIDSKISEITSGLAGLNQAAIALMNFFDGVESSREITFDITHPLNSGGVTFSDCVSRISIAQEISKKFPSSQNMLMVPLRRFDALISHINDSRNHVATLSNQFRHILNVADGYQEFNHDNFHLHTKNGQQHDMRPLFSNFADSVEGFLESFFSVLFILRPEDSGFTFQSASEALSKIFSRLKEESSDNLKQYKALIRLLGAAQSDYDKLHAALDEVGRVKEEGEKDRRTIAEYLAEATVKKESIEAVHSGAASLKADIEAYQEEFSTFQKQLDARKLNFESGRKRQAELFQDFENKEKKVADLIVESERMLKGATVSGLAKAFHDAHSDLGSQLDGARHSFYFGIFFLLVSSLPLMAYIFLPILAPLLSVYFPNILDSVVSISNQEEITGWQYLGQVLARFIVLLPAAWFVSFSAIRHSSLFRLREHYAYKYSMAMSVEGFKKQATGYESEVAALVLEQIAFNPADKLVASKDVVEGKPPGPILQAILNKISAKK